MKAFRALTRTTVRASFRNRTALIFTLGLSFLFMVIFGVLFGGNTTSITMDIVNLDHNSKQSQAFIDTLNKAGATTETTDINTAADDLKNDKIALYVTIPQGFGAVASAAGNSTTDAVTQSGLPSHVVVTLTSGAGGSTSVSIATQIISNVVTGFNTGGHATAPPIGVQSATTATHNITAIDYLLPGLIGYIVLQSGINYVAIGLVELRVRRVLRRYRAAPLTPFQILGSQIVAGMVTVLLQLVVLIALGMTLFQAQTYGNMLLTIIPIVIGTAAFVGIGFLLTSAARTSEAARGFATMIALPMMFLSGVFFPIDGFPSWLRTIVHILPLTWLIDALRSIMNDGAGLGAIAGNCLVLAAWAVGAMAIATWRFRWD